MVAVGPDAVVVPVTGEMPETGGTIDILHGGFILTTSLGTDGGGSIAVSAGTLLAYVAVCLAVVRLRRERPDLERPFRLPWGSLIPLVGVAALTGVLLLLPVSTLWRVAIWMAVLRMAKLVVPLPYLVRAVRRRARSGPRDAGREARLIATIDRVAAHMRLGVEDNCLERSLVAYRFLAGAGASPELVVGVARDERGVRGHAWVTVDGRPVGESIPGDFEVMMTWLSRSSLSKASSTWTSWPAILPAAMRRLPRSTAPIAAWRPFTTNSS